MGNTNADNLIDRILADAQASVDKILSDADASCEELRRDRDKRIAENAAAQLRTRETQVKEILDGAATRARLDGRKELLAAKREVLDQTFETAYRTLCEQNADWLSALYARVLKVEAEAGDTVVPAAPDREAVQRAIALSGADVRMADQDAPAERGFLLLGKSYEKDCSLSAILSELRDREETKVAEVLFS